MSLQLPTVIIADDHQIFVEGLKKVLLESDVFPCRVVGTAHTGKQLLHMLRTEQPDFLLLDMNMPDMDGLEVLGAIRERGWQVQVIILTMYDEPRIVRTAFKSGADAYILKGNGIRELFRALKEVSQGNRFFGEGVNFTAEWNAPPSSEKQKFEDRFVKRYQLTKREMEVLRLISQAMTNKEIAKALYISDQTVSVHRKNIMRKLGVSSTASLIKMAYDHSLI